MLFFSFSFVILCVLTTRIQYDFVYQLFLNLYITYTKFYKFLFLVSTSLGFKTINWSKTFSNRLLNRLVGQATLLCKPSRAFRKKKKKLTGNEASSNLAYPTQADLKSNKVVWLDSFSPVSIQLHTTYENEIEFFGTCLIFFPFFNFKICLIKQLYTT